MAGNLEEAHFMRVINDLGYKRTLFQKMGYDLRNSRQ